MAAYQMLDRWVREWRIGERDGLETPGNPGGASVILRLDGQVIGRGVDVSGGADTLRLAAGLALAEATARLPVERDALMEQNRRALADRITVSMELSGPLIPFSPAEYADAAADISPGIDGVACRFGGAVAALFPMQMLMSGMDGARGLSAAVAKAANEPGKGLVKPADLARDDHAVFYRFKTVHVAQLAPRATPTFLDRGGRVIAQSEMTTAELRRWADGLAANLLGRCGRGIGPQCGAYNPVTGTSDPAPPAEQYLAALALMNYGSLPQMPTHGREAIESWVRLCEQLDAKGAADIKDGQIDPVFASARVCASMNHWGFLPDNADAWNFHSGPSMAHAFSVEGGFAPDLPRSAQGLVACALVYQDMFAGVFAAGGDSIGSAAVSAAFRGNEAGMLVSQMPWLGWAEIARSRKVGPQSGEIASAVALREMRAMVWRHQVLPDSLPPGQGDLAGGIEFTAARSPAPSWQSARPLAFIATMLGDPRLTEPQEVMPELNRLMASLRFLRQLSAGPAEGHMYADPDAGMWGVRAGPWDQSMPVDATAMTLLTVCETLRSLDAISERAKAPPK
jgi:hypothetical protein